MKYKVTITELAEGLLEHILYYISNQLKNPEAASNLLNEIEQIYNSLEYNPKIYAFTKDMFLKSKGYRKAIIPHYDYVIIFVIEEELQCVYIAGFFTIWNYTKVNYELFYNEPGLYPELKNLGFPTEFFLYSMASFGHWQIHAIQ